MLEEECRPVEAEVEVLVLVPQRLAQQREVGVEVGRDEIPETVHLRDLLVAHALLDLGREIIVDLPELLLKALARLFFPRGENADEHDYDDDGTHADMIRGESAFGPPGTSTGTSPPDAIKVRRGGGTPSRGSGPTRR